MEYGTGGKRWNTAQVENGGKRQWNLVDLESHDILPNSAILLLACLLLAPWRPFVDIYMHPLHCLFFFFLSFSLVLDPCL